MIQETMITAAIIGLGQLSKGMGMPAKHVPLQSVILGIISGAFLTEGTIEVKIFTGIVMGLTASGLYSSAKHMMQEK